MKVVVLVEGSRADLDEMEAGLPGKSHQVIDTKNRDELHEYKILINNIKEFSKSGNEVMLAKFSGRESITNRLGDELPEMIIPLSKNKNSRYYVECPVSTFLDLIEAFEKGD